MPPVDASNVTQIIHYEAQSHYQLPIIARFHNKMTHQMAVDTSHTEYAIICV